MSRSPDTTFLPSPDIRGASSPITCVYNGDVRSVVLSNPTQTHRRSVPLHLIQVCRNITCHRLYDKHIGSAVARFELSTLPEHGGANVMVVRIIQILEPVECVLPDHSDHSEYHEKMEQRGNCWLEDFPSRRARSAGMVLRLNFVLTIHIQILDHAFPIASYLL